MISLKKFQSAAEAAGNRDIAFNLTTDKVDLRSTGSGIARWIKNLNTSKNREVSRLFINTLERSYGEQIANQVVDKMDLGTRLARGKPLRSRKIMEALNLAESIKGQFAEANKDIAASYNRSAAGFDTTLLQIKFDHIAKRLFGKNCDLPQLRSQSNLATVGQKIEEEINLAGRNGKHFVTTEEADKIAEWSLVSSLTKGYRAAVMEQLSMTKTDSLSQQALAKINSGSRTGLTINPSDLEGSVVREINQQFTDKLSDAMFRKINVIKSQGIGLDASLMLDEIAPGERKDGLTAAFSEAELQEMTDEVIGKFANERFAAGEAVQRLPITNPTAKAVLLERILHDNMPASMVPAFGAAYLQLADQFPELGKEPRLSPQELQNVLIEIHDSVMNVMKGGNLSVETRDPVMQGFWRAFLANYSDTQLRGIASQMDREGSPFRSFGEGVHYFRYVFPQSATYQKNLAIYESSVETAGEYDCLLGNLAQVLQDKMGAPQPFVGVEAKEMLSDSVIVMLRNAGIAVPAPNRVGESNKDVTLSDQALAMVQEDLIKGSDISGKRIRDGMLDECTRDFGRAVYRLGGEDLGNNPEVIIGKLRQFCTDDSGKLNEEMLLGISKFAYQATPGILMSLLAPGVKQVAPFQYVPSAQQGRGLNAEYDITQNDQGDITIRAKVFGGSSALGDPYGQDIIEFLPLNPDTSHFGMMVELSLDAKTFQPTLNTATMDYAFYPAEAGGGE